MRRSNENKVSYWFVHDSITKRLNFIARKINTQTNVIIFGIHDNFKRMKESKSIMMFRKHEEIKLHNEVEWKDYSE